MGDFDAASAATMPDRPVAGARVKERLPVSMPQSAVRDAVQLAIVCVQLALVLLVIQQYEVESRTFFNVMALGFGGFVVHALLPLRYRPAFFVALSFAAILLAFGLRDGGCLILLGLVLIGISHLPFRLGARILLLVLTAIAFGLWRLEMLPAPWSVAIWPILGSMFMFRIALYLYALKHDDKRPTAAATLSYFFMLPNVCFPLFPVVDYSTFRRTYYDRDANEIYETGIKWIVRGLVHLILYRFVYLHLAGDPMELRTLGALVQFLVATFMLYLRISGQFHLITGVLHLYGFRLPETHHLYFLASNFTDFWRRINIYWKDFMMKLVYYPSFFMLKRFGSSTALIGATVVVFVGTWLLHSYQWFWLRGGFPLAPQDGLFWGTLGLLVVMGALGEMKRSRARKLGGAAPWSFSLALRTTGTFIAICVLWSLWSAESLGTWLLMWGAAGTTSARELLTLSVLLAVGVVIAGKDWSGAQKQGSTSSPFYWSAAASTSTLIVLLALSWTGSYSPVAPALASAVASVQRSTLNAVDAELQHKGYYENLDNNSRMNAQLWDVTGQRPASWIPLADTKAYRLRHNFAGDDLQPDTGINFDGQSFTTNSWGMRDRERVLSKPAGTYRIAMLGPSHIMGSGVSDENTSSRLLEEILNRSGDGRRYEVLNFGVAGYALTQQLAILDEKVFRFAPDAIFFTDSPRLSAPIIAHLLQSAQSRQTIPFSRLQKLVRETGVDALGRDGVPVLFDPGREALERLGVKTRMPWVEAERRLRDSTDEILRATFDEIGDVVRSHGLVPVFVALDNVSEPPVTPMPALQDASAAGMLVFDLLDLWHGRDQSALRIASWDNHPNEAGNRLVAARLQALIQEHAAQLQLDADPARTPVAQMPGPAPINFDRHPVGAYQ